jgi:predicted flap endonuclease-1-like 5' DNA nuclease
MASLVEIEGVGKLYAEKLKMAGIRGTRSFLEWGATPVGRKQIAERTGIDEDKLLEWLNHADLMRVKGIGSEYSDLLEAAGVDTIVELARRNAQNLYQQLVMINNEKKLVRKMPTQSQVRGWIDQAKTLPRLINY